MLTSINPTTTKSWRLLEEHFQVIRNQNMKDILGVDSERATDFKIEWEDFYFDYSKNLIDKKTISLLMQLAEEVKLKDAIQAQFSGKKINQTEDRAVLHTALRDFKDMRPDVKANLKKMQAFSKAVIDGHHKGYTGKAITDVVNIGIGGSHLGPEMLTKGLHHYSNHLKTHFVANIDGDQLHDILKSLNPETTLFIIVSKSFTTQETLVNARHIRQWFLEHTVEENVQQHFVAVSVNEKAVEEFGISKENIFSMHDWVGGRFSLWGSVGLSICCAIGYDNFKAVLEGAFEMDTHFKETEFSENIPVVLALLSIWYNNFFKAQSEVVVAYSEYLYKLVPYLQQASMESNGKSVDRNGDKIDYQTGTIVWGSTGSNSQHAYFQLLHQGTKLIPADFIGFSEPLNSNTLNHNILMANFFAQTESLWEGTADEADKNPFKSFDGNKPSNSILIKRLTPHALGSLIAMYEHKIFVQGIIWNIYSYDQWGVELGKKVAKNTLACMDENNSSDIKNSSTRELLTKYLNDQGQI